MAVREGFELILPSVENWHHNWYQMPVYMVGELCEEGASPLGRWDPLLLEGGSLNLCLPEGLSKPLKDNPPALHRGLEYLLVVSGKGSLKADVIEFRPGERMVN